MFAPHDLGVGDVEARSVSLSWSWTVQRYHNLSLNCQMIVSDADGSVRLQGRKTSDSKNITFNLCCVDIVSPDQTWSRTEGGSFNRSEAKLEI